MALNCGGRPPDTTKSGYLLENSSNNPTNESIVPTMFNAPGSSHMLSGPYIVGSLHDYTQGDSANARVHPYYGCSSHVLLQQQQQQQVGDHEMNGEAAALYMNNYNQTLVDDGMEMVVDDGVEMVVDEKGYRSEAKKRRLTNQQVKSLEVSFEMETKLEPERKNQLAQELGLQPRQVAVWFQNRRARYKTKQLERDYDILKKQYHAVRSETETLQSEVARLKDLLDAQIADGKGTFTPTKYDQGQDELERQHENRDEDLHNLSTRNGAGKQKASTVTSSPGEQKAKLSPPPAEGDAFSSDDSVQTHVHVMVEAASKSPNEVKPSLQVADHQQHQFHSNLNPTKLSLCSPQQVLLHHMIAVKMEETFNLHEPDYNIYNEHYSFHNINDDDDDDDEEASDAMLCFNTWHHDP